MKQWLASLREFHAPNMRAREILRYLGPGILVTVGFIDPGNWAANVAAGSEYGYKLLWMVTLSTLMLIMLQHNVAHLGIATGLCLSEAATIYVKPWISRFILLSAVVAAVSTAMAELLGAAIALNMLCKIPLRVGAALTAIIVYVLLSTNSYRRLERWIIGFVSLIGLCFLFELSMVKIDWVQAGIGWVNPALPMGALPVVMSVLGAVVMPHNLFLHSEIIQSRQWNLEEPEIIEKQLRFEFLDTLISMGIGWAINSAMILVAAATFYQLGVKVTELEQAESMLRPLLGNTASVVFALALLFAGFASSVTAGMAGGSIVAGMFREPYDMGDRHSRIGVAATLGLAVVAIFFLEDPFQGLVVSQILLSVQLPWTIFLQLYLTSATKVMGRYANTGKEKIILWAIAITVAVLNIWLFFDAVF